MTVDLLTLSIALNLANVLQCMALVGLAVANRERAGLRWWAAGMGVLALGLILTSVRDVMSLPLWLHTISNAMVGNGILMLYYGLRRFFGDNDDPRRFIVIGLLIFIANVVLAFTGDIPPLRRILFSVVVAILSLLIAIRLYQELHSDRRTIVLFLVVVFIANGIFFVLRGITTATEANWLIVSPPWQMATYLTAIATTTLWTFGLILLVNQELIIKQRETAQQLELIFDAQPDAVLLSRLTDGVFVKVNQGFVEISGYRAEEALGKDGLKLNIWRSPEDRQRWAELMQREGSCSGLEFEFRRRDGTFRTCLLSSRMVMIAGVPHAISIVHDITERKQIEEALRRSDARYRLIAENTSDVIWLFDPMQERFTFFSPSVQKLTGYSVTEAMAVSVTDLLTPSSAQQVLSALHYMLHEWQGELTTAPPWVAEIELIHRDGHEVQVEIVTTFVRDEDNRLMVLGVARDITARKQAEIELRLARQQAEAANRAKSAFLANVSHELRTPLHAVLGFAHLLSNDSELTATQREYLNIINRNGEHLLRLINDVLDLAKIEAGRYTYTPAPVDVRRLLADLQTLFCPRIEAKQLQFVVTCTEEVPAIILSDEAKIRQILINLLENAIKFTEVGVVKLQVERSQQQILFIVEDTGVGISPLEQPYLFRPFFQGRQAVNDHSTGGAGLGLSISYELARVIGGNLSVYSAGEGCGARLTLTLPLRTPITTPLSLPAQHESRRVIRVRVDQPVYRMLVADDIPASALLLVTLLHRLGFVVQSVADEQTLLTMWRSWQPHMIWLDVDRTRINGLAVAQQIRTACHNEPGLMRPVMIALSANVLSDTPTTAIESGCDEFIAKPFREHDVIRIIEQYLHIQFEEVVPQMTTLPNGVGDDCGYDRGWCQAIRQAAVEAHFSRLQQLITDIESTRPDDARQLWYWLETFNYQALIEWVDAILASQARDSRV
ncbi:PAS domain S-box protein [Chloroflexus sp. Y-396-1]|uniref:PAS domain S-box protein n=1 Tax=Chloroflexus sp. Y-396-1 TaxID=867845 RepID=UPI00048CB5D8|nr:PAS domain S-box protein [Chloroflexus sp. Y-396-1]